MTVFHAEQRSLHLIAILRFLRNSKRLSQVWLSSKKQYVPTLRYSAEILHDAPNFWTMSDLRQIPTELLGDNRSLTNSKNLDDLRCPTSALLDDAQSPTSAELLDDVRFPTSAESLDDVRSPTSAESLGNVPTSAQLLDDVRSPTNADRTSGRYPISDEFQKFG